MIYVWLNELEIMQEYGSHESFERMMSTLDPHAREGVMNQESIKIFIEENTKRWDD